VTVSVNLVHTGLSGLGVGDWGLTLGRLVVLLVAASDTQHGERILVDGALSQCLLIVLHRTTQVALRCQQVAKEEVRLRLQGYTFISNQLPPIKVHQTFIFLSLQYFL